MKAVVFLATEQIKAEQDCCRKRFCGSVDDDMTAMVASAERDPFL
jgi:predicted transcriptional regulator of viral defense system